MLFKFNFVRLVSRYKLQFIISPFVVYNVVRYFYLFPFYFGFLYILSPQRIRDSYGFSLVRPNRVSGLDSGFISEHLHHAPRCSFPPTDWAALALVFICTEMYNFSESNVNTFSVFLWIPMVGSSPPIFWSRGPRAEVWEAWHMQMTRLMLRK